MCGVVCGRADYGGGAGDREFLRTAAASEQRQRKKSVTDRRASKGRKVRYTLQPKIANFMQPVPPLPHAIALADQLFSNLFGIRRTDGRTDA